MTGVDASFCAASSGLAGVFIKLVNANNMAAAVATAAPLRASLARPERFGSDGKAGKEGHDAFRNRLLSLKFAQRFSEASGAGVGSGVMCIC